jgi:hypothetical protein
MSHPRQPDDLRVIGRSDAARLKIRRGEPITEWEELKNWRWGSGDTILEDIEPGIEVPRK